MAGDLEQIDVVVLAGGLGTRIRSVLGDTPKILAPVHGKPFLMHLLERLKALGAGRAILSLGYRADAVIDYLKNNLAPLPVVTVIENEPLGTAGGVRLTAQKTSTSPVMIVNGDTWLETDYRAFFESHRKQGVACSILCVPVDDVSAYGSVEIDDKGRIQSFTEKGSKTGSGMISGGVYMFERAALDALAKGTKPSLEKDFFQVQPAGTLHGFRAKECIFLDIGTPDNFAAAAGIIATK